MMTADPNALELFGTDQPGPVRRVVQAGLLSVVLEDGNLRDIRFGGVEVLRGISYLVRDSGWGTLAAIIEAMDICEAPDRFEVTYRADIAGPDGHLTYEMAIEGRAEGVLTVRAKAMAKTDFLTNRTGFVVLHPDTVAGFPLRISHTDGHDAETFFPVAISPDQPAFDIAALEHDQAGLTCRVSFEGGPFEMEDQRNWSDASFKTYVRPLSLPRPYQITAGSRDEQAVVLRVTGVASVPGDYNGDLVTPRLHKTAGAVPPLWLRLDPDMPVPDWVPDNLAGLVYRIDPAGQGTNRLEAVRSLLRGTGTALAIEAILPHRNPQAEARSLLDLIGLDPVPVLMIAAVRDLRTRRSNTLPDGEVPQSAMVAALRANGYAGLIGLGTTSFFTEFNRNPPGTGADFVWFGTSAIVHAADEISVMETTGVLPAIFASAKALSHKAPLWLGPAVIAPLATPYSDDFAANPDLQRICMSRTDPRHASLFGASHMLAVLAHGAGACAAICPAFATGPSGLVDGNSRRLPVSFVHAAFAAAKGRDLLRVDAGKGIVGLGWSDGDHRTILITNIGPLACDLAVADLSEAEQLAPSDAGWVRRPADGHLTLGPYATWRLRQKI